MTRRSPVPLVIALAVALAIGLGCALAWVGRTPEAESIQPSRPRTDASADVPSFASGRAEAPAPSALAAPSPELAEVEEVRGRVDEAPEDPPEEAALPPFRLEVQVVDSAGGAVSGAMVSAFADDVSDAVSLPNDISKDVLLMMREVEPSWDEPLGSWRTDGSGVAAFDAPDQVLHLVAERDDKGSSGIVTLFGSQDPDRRTPLRLKLLPRCTLRGRVLEMNGAPAVGARVLFSRTYMPNAAQRRPRMPAALEADADGRFSIGADAEFFAEVHAERGATKTVPAFVHVGSGDETEFELRFPGGFEVTGLVVGPDGKPVEGASVSVAGFSVQAESADSDASGRFRIELSRPCHVVLRAEAKGLAQERVVSATVSDAQPSIGVSLQLVQEAVISGRVRWKDGAPFQRGSVMAQPVQPNFTSPADVDDLRAYLSDEDNVNFELSMFATASIKADSSFEIDGLPPRRAFNLTLLTSEPVLSQPKLSGVVAGADDVELIAEHAGPEGLVLKGRVIDAASRSPLAACELRCVDWRFRAINYPLAVNGAVQGLDGHFEFEELRPDTEYALVATAVNCPPQTFGPFKPGSLDLELAVGRAGALLLRVTDPEGRPREASVLLAEDAEASFTSMMADLNVLATDASGRLDRADLAPGGYTLAISAGSARAVAKLQIAPAQTTTVDAVLADSPGTGRLEARVQSSDGRPMGEATVRVLRIAPGAPKGSGADVVWSSRANAEGLALFEGLPAGKYAVVARSTSPAGILPSSAVIVEGGTATVLLQAKPDH